MAVWVVERSTAEVHAVHVGPPALFERRLVMSIAVLPGCVAARDDAAAIAHSEHEPSHGDRKSVV